MAGTETNKTQRQTYKKRKTTRKKSVVDSAARNAAPFTEICHLRRRLPIYTEIGQSDIISKSEVFMLFLVFVGEMREHILLNF